MNDKDDLFDQIQSIAENKPFTIVGWLWKCDSISMVHLM